MNLSDNARGMLRGARSYCFHTLMAVEKANNPSPSARLRGCKQGSDEEGYRMGFRCLNTLWVHYKLQHPEDDSKP